MTDNDPKRSGSATDDDTSLPSIDAHAQHDSTESSVAADSVGSDAGGFAAGSEGPPKPGAIDADLETSGLANENGEGQTRLASSDVDEPASDDPARVGVAAASVAAGESTRSGSEPIRYTTDTVDRSARRTGRFGAILGVLALVLAGAVGYWLNDRFDKAESEFVRRLQAGDQRGAAIESTQKQAQNVVSDLQGRIAVLESKVAESAGLRAQVEKLFQDRAEDGFEVLLVEVDSALTLASQQLALGANPQVILARLEDLDAKIERDGDARLEKLRATMRKDIEMLRAYPATDVGSIAMRIDAVMGTLDKLPLRADLQDALAAEAQSQAVQLAAAADTAPVVPAPDSPNAPNSPDAPDAPASDGASAPAPSGAAASTDGSNPPSQSAAVDAREPSRWQALVSSAQDGLRRFGVEVRSLFQVRRLDAPDAMLLAPDQAYFLRQNLKLTLLDARVALLTRSDDVYRSDLERALRWIESYYDTSHRGVESVVFQLRQLASAKLVLEPPRINETLTVMRAVRAASR